jgi:hypothetical protein
MTFNPSFDNGADPAPETLQQIQVTRVHTVAYVGSIDDFVHYMNLAGEEHWGEGLDSLDGGDATGMALKLHSYFQDEMGFLLYQSADEKFTLTVTYEEQNFIWTPPHP